MIGNTSVTIFIGHFLPGWKAGGPVRTVLEMLETSPPDLDITVITSDRDLGDTERYSQLTGRVATVAGANVIYTNWRDAREALTTIRGLFQKQSDIVIINSFFATYSALLPIVLSSFGIIRGEFAIGPRGEFSPGALGLKARKKTLYLRTVGKLRSVRRATWIATSDQESGDIRRLFPKARIEIVPDSRGSKPASVAIPAQDSVRFIFLGRISPKKNLIGALESLASIPATLSVTFHIYGTIEDVNYWSKCQEIADAAPSHVNIAYCGEAQPDQTKSIFSKYDAFVFPTLGENFGHVIHESLSQGCPILLSDTTPWSRLIQEGGGRLCRSPRDLANAVQEIASLNAIERTALKKAALASYTEWWGSNTPEPPLETLVRSATRRRQNDPVHDSDRDPDY